MYITSDSHCDGRLSKDGSQRTVLWILTSTGARHGPQAFDVPVATYRTRVVAACNGSPNAVASSPTKAGTRRITQPGSVPECAGRTVKYHPLRTVASKRAGLFYRPSARVATGSEVAYLYPQRRSRPYRTEDRIRCIPGLLPLNVAGQ